MLAQMSETVLSLVDSTTLLLRHGPIWLNCICLVLIFYYILHVKTSCLVRLRISLTSRSNPGPRRLPIIGNLHQLGREPHVKMTEWSKKYGDVYFLQMGKWETVVLNKLPAIRKSLLKNADSFSGRPDFYTFRYIGNGKSMGFGNYGPRWKMHRKIAQSALMLFVKSKQNPVADTVINEAKVLVSNLAKNGGTEFIDPHNEIYLSVGSIICVICFGKHYQRHDEDFKKLIQVNDDFMAYAAAGNPVDVLPWTRHFTKKAFDKFVGMLSVMDEFCNKKHKDHVATYDPNEVRDVTDALIRSVESVDDKDREAVGLTDSHILTTVQEMIAAGFDTIATTLHWALLYMVTHPRSQERAQKEIDDVIGRARYPNMEDHSKLPYTEACIHEIMRLSCIFPFALPHATTKDTYLDGHFIPDKTLVFVNLWSVNRDEKTFPEPHRFIPERFLDTDGSIDQEMVDNFLPFGAGRRKCPGEPLAKIEIFLFFCTLLQRCSFHKVPGETYKLESKFGLTLKPFDYKINIKSRI